MEDFKVFFKVEKDHRRFQLLNPLITEILVLLYVEFHHGTLRHQDKPIHIDSMHVFEVAFLQPGVLQLEDAPLSIVILILQNVRFRGETYIEFDESVLSQHKIVFFQSGVGA